MAVVAERRFRERRCSVTPHCCLLVHVVMFVWYVFTIWFNCSITSTWRHLGARTYGGRWKYLTFINLVMQMLFFGLCVLTDVIHVSFLRKSGAVSLLITLQDFFFSVLAFPVTMFVSVTFWSIYTFDRELVFPKVLDDIIPTWLNHAMHSVILLPLLVQMYLQHHAYPSRSRGILALALFASLYLAWVLWIRHASGIWVYPIMSHLSPVGLVLFISVASLSMAPLYLLGEKLNRVIWDPTGNQKKKKK